jgi:hypothetical protein
MTPEQDLLTALRALADADRHLEAPPQLEDRLRSAFRARHRQRQRRIRIAWTLAAAAVLILAVAPALIHVFVANTHRVRSVEPAQAVNRPPDVIPQPLPVPSSAPPSAPARRIVPVGRAPGREIMTEFFPLVDPAMNEASPMDRGELVRVNLPAAAMRTVGLPVREDRLTERVQADVLVSEDGLATAIRFVKNSGPSGEDK